MHQHAVEEYGAFYSSALGGITTQPALMVVPADDQIVHRGYAVWENVGITDGHLYQLDRHIERLLFSAELAGLELPMPPAALKRIVLDTAAASLKINGIVKVWLTGGRGSFGLGQAPGMPCEVYVLATSENKGLETEQRIKGWRAARSPIPPLLPPLSVVKGTSQLHAAMAQLEVESRGYDIPLFTYGDDDDTVVAFGVDNAFAIIDEDDVLITMPQDDKVPSVAMQRLIEIIPAANKKCPDDVVVKGFDQRPLTVEDVLKAKEAFVISTADSVMGIVSIDDQPVADGEPGVTTLALHQILNNDKQPRPDSKFHTEVPFGYVTGMWSQLQ